jgi:uncharacterized protein (TIGR03000 family)
MHQKMFSFGGTLLLAGAAVLMTTGAVQAGGGGHGGGSHAGGHVGGFRGGSTGYRGGYYHGSYGGGYGYRPYYGYRHYYGGYYPNYSFYNYYPYLDGGGSGGDYGSYGNAYSLGDTYADYATLLNETLTYRSGYRGLSDEEYQAYAAASASNRSAPAPVDAIAHVTVRVPAEAQVWIEGTKTASTGPVRQFQSPQLTPGSKYTYDIKASWNENGHDVTQTQKVEVTAGAYISVAFPTTTQAGL